MSIKILKSYIPANPLPNPLTPGKYYKRVNPKPKPNGPWGWNAIFNKYILTNISLYTNVIY